MSSYENDPRVRRVRDERFGDYFRVTGDVEYDVTEEESCRWFTQQTVDPGAAPGTREADARVRGPFPSRDAAFASLIGPPR